MKTLELFCLVLLIISGLLWGLIGLFDFNLLDEMGIDWITRMIGFAFGASAIITAIYWSVKRQKQSRAK